jgi:hypothetical protein
MQGLASTILLANAAATVFMTGLIWFVQVVHYPLFAKVGPEVFPAYSRAHQMLTTLVVGPPMLVEAATAALLVIVRPAGTSAGLAWTGFDADTNAFLVSTNWIRTICWTARTAVVGALLMQAMRPAP